MCVDGEYNSCEGERERGGVSKCQFMSLYVESVCPSDKISAKMLTGELAWEEVKLRQKNERFSRKDNWMLHRKNCLCKHTSRVASLPGKQPIVRPKLARDAENGRITACREGHRRTVGVENLCLRWVGPTLQ